MNFKIIWRALLGLTAILFVSWTVYLWSQGASLKAWYRLGANKIHVISNADEVEIFRVKRGIQSAQSIGRFAITATSQKQNKPPNSQLSRAVFSAYNTASILFTNEKDCIFDPGISFRFIKGNQKVDALVCFSCSDMMLASDKYGGPTFIEFGEVLPQFKALAKKAFPRDAEIQKL